MNEELHQFICKQLRNYSSEIQKFSALSNAAKKEMEECNEKTCKLSGELTELVTDIGKVGLNEKQILDIVADYPIAVDILNRYFEN